MAEFSFEIAKKFQTGQAKGMELRSISLVPDGYRAVLREAKQNYSIVKDSAAAFRLEKSAKINCKGVGKSFEVVSDSLVMLADILRSIKIVNDDMSVFLDFVSSRFAEILNIRGFEVALGDINLGPKAVTMSFIAKSEEGTEPEALFETLLPIVHEYDMGLIK